MSAEVERARREFADGRVGEAVKILDAALWTAVARSDRPAVAAILQLLTEIAPSTSGRARRRSEYLVQAAREQLAAKLPAAGEAAGAGGAEAAPDERAAAADADRLANLERELADVREALHRDERRLLALELEVRALAGWMRGAARAAPSPPPARAPAPAPAVPAAPVTPAPPAPPRRPAAPRRPPRDWSELLGPRTLAWAGGIVTSLGIVFLYSLAVSRGWIGPVVRVGTGAAVSALVFAAGVWLRRRFGTTYASLGAAGAGIAGGYATLLAAVALYELLPKEIALVVAAGIAAVGVATALAWSAEMVAGLGLVGAILAPVALVFDEGFTTLGTGFALVVLVAAALVALSRRWSGVLVTATAASAPQALVLVLDERGPAVIVTAALFALAYLAAALAWHRPERALGSLAASLVLLSGGIASLASQQLFDGDARGLALLAAAAVYGLVAGALTTSVKRRDAGTLLAALALTLAAVGLAQVISGQALAIAWAAEAALLAWLARKIDEERYQLGAVAYLALAAGHALEVDAPLTDFLEPTPDPAAGVPTVAAVGFAAFVLARYAGSWRARRIEEGGAPAVVAPLFAALRGAQPLVRAAALFTAVFAGSYALSLAVLELVQRVGSAELRTAFEHGHAAVDASWSVLALALLAFALLRGHERLAVAALTLYGALFAKAVLFDVGELAETPRGLGLLAIAASSLLACALWQRLAVGVTRLDVFSGLLVGASVALGVPAAVDLADGHVGRLDLDGAALLAVAAVYGLLAVAVFRSERDLSGVLSGVALVLVGWGLSELVAGNWLVAAWAAVAAFLAWLSTATRDLRFLLASAGYLALGLLHVLAFEAPPSDLFLAQRHPGGGAPALVALAAAGLAFALACRPHRDAAAPEADDPYGTRALAFSLESRVALWRTAALWGAAVATVDAVSLAILEVAQALSHVTVDTAFQRGHTGVSAYWSVLALALLYVGLVRRRGALRAAGLALFGLTLAKIFVYDLAALSAMARALSFLAVGVLLLAAGFFYQRLSGRLDERGATAQ